MIKNSLESIRFTWKIRTEKAIVLQRFNLKISPTPANVVLVPLSTPLFSTNSNITLLRTKY